MDLQIKLEKILELSKQQDKTTDLKNEIIDITSSYVPDGNPILQRNIYYLLNAFKIIKSDFKETEYEQIKNWAINIAKSEIYTFQKGFGLSNRFQSHRIKNIAFIGYTFDEETLLDWAREQFLLQIDKSILPDGNCMDFVERDSLTYSVNTLYALLLALQSLSRHYDFDFYNYESPSGASFKKAIWFLIPYIKGEKQNKMFLNSTFKSDKQIYRKEYGKRWNKFNAKYMIYECCYYDKDIIKIYDNFMRI
jgi:hypothetical protein